MIYYSDDFNDEKCLVHAIDNGLASTAYVQGKDYDPAVQAVRPVTTAWAMIAAVEGTRYLRFPDVFRSRYPVKILGSDCADQLTVYLPKESMTCASLQLLGICARGDISVYAFDPKTRRWGASRNAEMKITTGRWPKSLTADIIRISTAFADDLPVLEDGTITYHRHFRAPVPAKRLRLQYDPSLESLLKPGIPASELCIFVYCDPWTEELQGVIKGEFGIIEGKTLRTVSADIDLNMLLQVHRTAAEFKGRFVKPVDIHTSKAPRFLTETRACCT